MDAGNDLLTVEEVAIYLRKSPSTVYRLTRQGRLPGRKVGGTWRFSRRAIDAWLLQPTVNTEPVAINSNFDKHIGE